jgi:Fe2+ transport system protein FeoA
MYARHGRHRLIQQEDKNYVPLLKCLTDCERGEQLEVAAIRAGYKAKQRLAHLGVFPGTKIIKKKSAPWNGPLEIMVRGTSLVIGRGLANKILVICQNNNCIN